MALKFKKYAADGEQFVADLARQLRGPDDSERAGRVLRAVLHALRDQISVTESMQMVAQLPMFIKAVYVDGWKISAKPKKIRNYFDFIESVRSSKKGLLPTDFYSEKEAEDAIYAVFGMIKDKVSAGEIRDVMSTLPEELKYFMEDA